MAIQFRFALLVLVLLSLPVPAGVASDCGDMALARVRVEFQTLYDAQNLAKCANCSTAR